MTLLDWFHTLAAIGDAATSVALLKCSYDLRFHAGGEPTVAMIMAVPPALAAVFLGGFL